MKFSRQHLRQALNFLRPGGRVIERWARRLPGSEENAGTAAAAAQRTIRGGLWLTAVVFGVFGLWGGLAPLDSAAVAPGQVVFDSNRKTIQHLEGGIVEEILVREGQSVEAGQPLLRLRGTAFKSKLATLQTQYFTAQATQARLKGEQALLDTLEFPVELTEAAKNDPEKQEALAGQQRLFSSRRQAYAAQIASLNEKIEEYKHDIDGFTTQERAGTTQLSLLDEEIASTQRLFAKGYASKPRLLALQRQAEDIRGQRGQHRAAIAHTRQSIAETRHQIAAAEQDMLARTASEIKDTQASLADLGEQLRTSADAVERITVSAPIAGYVTGLGVHTVGGVITPGEKLMDIVPASDKLIVEAQVSPQDIDVVHSGLKAHIRLSAYRARWVPSIEGKVVTVSADRMTDSRNQASYFLARIEVDPEQFKHLPNISLYPGMPAETLIITGERTLLDYLLMPIAEATRKAFRED